MVVLVGAFGALVERAKSSYVAATELSIPSTLQHTLAFAMFAATSSSELIIAYSILMSKVREMYFYAYLLLVSRLVLHTPAVLFLMFDIMRQRSRFQPLVDTSHFFLHSSDVYGPLIFLSLFESSLLVYLPWYSSPFSLLTGFPNQLLLRTCLVSKLLQLVTTFVGQVGTLLSQVGDISSLFFIFVALNVSLSSICLVVALITTVLQWAVVSGTKMPRIYSKKDDVESPKELLVQENIQDGHVEVTASSAVSTSPMHS